VNALGCLLPAPVVATLGKYVSDLGNPLSTLFSLSFSPLLTLFAISYVRELEDEKEDEILVRHAGPVKQDTLKQLETKGGLKLAWADYRLGVLRFLEKKGVAGIGELMYNTMKHLMTARENMAQDG
jgi:centromere protein I